MNNINIQTVRPNQNNNNSDRGTFIAYNVYFDDQKHSVSGSFMATDDEVKSAESDASGDLWAGFKQLVAERLSTDAKSLGSVAATAATK